MVSKLSTPSRKKGNRGPKYIAEDWKALAQAYKSATLDPIKGTEQGGDEFWDAIADKFNDSLIGRPVRTGGALQTMWSKMKTDMTLYAQMVTAVRRSKPSGTLKEADLDIAKERFRDQKSSGGIGCEFKYFDAWQEVQDLPTFNPDFGRGIKELPKVPGRDKAKAEKRSKKISALIETPVGKKSKKNPEDKFDGLIGTLTAAAASFESAFTSQPSTEVNLQKADHLLGLLGRWEQIWKMNPHGYPEEQQEETRRKLQEAINETMYPPDAGFKRNSTAAAAKSPGLFQFPASQVEEKEDEIEFKGCPADGSSEEPSEEEVSTDSDSDSGIREISYKTPDKPDVEVQEVVEVQESPPEPVRASPRVRMTRLDKLNEDLKAAKRSLRWAEDKNAKKLYKLKIEELEKEIARKS